MRRTFLMGPPCSLLLVMLIAVSVSTCPVAVRAQSVTLRDEQVIFTIPDSDGGYLAETPGPVRLSPDGASLLYADPPENSGSEEPVQLVILRLTSLSDGKQRVEFRPDLGRSTGRDLWSHFLLDVFSPNGKLFVSPDFSLPEPRGPIQRRPILVCQLESGKVARTRIATDLRYAAIDHTGKLLLDMDGQSYSLVTGQPARRFDYEGFVVAANPVAPIVCVDTGVEGRRGPRHVNVWNLRDNKLLARLPHNEKFNYSTYVEPAWTSDGTYLYFGDAVGDHFPQQAIDDIPLVTRVWNVKTGKIVGDPLPWTRWRRPGPRAGTMMLSTEFAGGTEEPRQLLHDAATGATADLPVRILDAGGEKAAYVRTINGKPHLCVATLAWDAKPRNGAHAPPRTPATRSTRSIR